MEKERVKFLSSNGVNEIAGFIYFEYETVPKAVLQLSHGMCEYIERYEWVAKFLTSRGYVLAGNDHLGHGDSSPEKEYGIFYEEFLIQDLKTMNAIIRKRFGSLPIILYGHSMGSFFARWYAERYPETINGLILSGTAGPSKLNGIGKMLSGIISKLHRRGYVSKFLVKLNFGSYNQRIENPKSKNAWLTRNEEIVKKYDRDPKCQFSFSAMGYHAMLTVLTHVSKKEWAAALPKDLRVLQIAGAMDPVGNYGEGVKAVTRLLKEAGLKDVTEYIDANGRHELHNELNKEEVMEKVVTWLDKRYYE